ncbi:Farnesyl diphosphate synthase [Roseimaritima multifibrata]|uniref:Farnesyl diphosphate synthase n=1 Tax=Roseimaritima multifibrata TaxID=1930274 RepID=A0A517MF48_9BACT|nr:farnesyl diphosphate synthase [Roseimaritima multifibrata]QDS93509.1 Farnesyl diphosphate synthase [Roseimaritima multifibrata]
MPPTDSRKDAIDDLLSIIGDALETALPEQDGCPQQLREAMRYSLLSPGKRLRPALVLMAAEACGGDVQQVVPAAIAVEMIHAYSLIHDDLPAMDNDALRRGRPTCHIQFGEATAILAGDALLTNAFEVLATRFEPASERATAVAMLATAAGRSALVGGQMDDLAAETDGDHTLERLQAIHRRKTGALFNVSLQLGALSAGASDAQRKALQDYGDALGLAFQVIDDILDHGGHSAELGKETGRDAARGKLTYPALMGEESAREHAIRLINVADDAIGLFDSAGWRLNWLTSFVLQRI